MFILADGAVSWRSKKKTIVALSTTEAENVALSTAARENIWLSSIAGDLGLFANGAMQLSGDKKTALQMPKEAKLSEASKHIAITTISYEKLCNGVMMFSDIFHKENMAEILNKGLGGPLHNYNQNLMGIDLGTRNSVAKKECSDSEFKSQFRIYPLGKT